MQNAHNIHGLLCGVGRGCGAGASESTRGAKEERNMIGPAYDASLMTGGLGGGRIAS